MLHWILIICLVISASFKWAPIPVNCQTWELCNRVSGLRDGLSSRWQLISCRAKNSTLASEFSVWALEYPTQSLNKGPVMLSSPFVSVNWTLGAPGRIKLWFGEFMIPYEGLRMSKNIFLLSLDTWRKSTPQSPLKEDWNECRARTPILNICPKSDETRACVKLSLFQENNFRFCSHGKSNKGG